MSSNKRLAVGAGTIHLVLMASFQLQKAIESYAAVAVNWSLSCEFEANLTVTMKIIE